MADFYEVWLSRAAVLAKLDSMLEAREAAREQELKAATDIKRVYRGKVCELPCFLVPRWWLLHRRLCQSSLKNGPLSAFGLCIEPAVKQVYTLAGFDLPIQW